MSGSGNFRVSQDDEPLIYEALESLIFELEFGENRLPVCGGREKLHRIRNLGNRLALHRFHRRQQEMEAMTDFAIEVLMEDDSFIEPPPLRPTRTIRVTLEYLGRAKPLPWIEDEDALHDP